MKKYILFGTITMMTLPLFAQQEKEETITGNIEGTVEWVYKYIIPQLNNVNFNGGGKISNELNDRWNRVINHLNSKKGTMTEDVKRLLVSPSGQVIDFDLIRKFVNIEKKDSSLYLNINPERLLDELKKGADNVRNAAEDMAKNRKY